MGLTPTGISGSASGAFDSMAIPDQYGDVAVEERGAREAIENPVEPSPKIPLVEVQGIKMLQLQFTSERAAQIVEMLSRVAPALGTDNAWDPSTSSSAGGPQGGRDAKNNSRVTP